MDDERPRKPKRKTKRPQVARAAAEEPHEPIQPVKKPTSPLAVVVGIVAAIASFFAARYVYDAIRGPRERPVSTNIQEKSWVAQRLPRSDVEIDAPWPLEETSTTIPPVLASLVEHMTSLGHEEDGLTIMASTMAMKEGQPSLDGAVDGMIGSARGVQGTLSVDPVKRETTVLGLRALEVEMRIERQGAAPLLYESIVWVDGTSALHVDIIHLVDQPAGRAAWERIKKSIRRVE